MYYKCSIYFIKIIIKIINVLFIKIFSLKNVFFIKIFIKIKKKIIFLYINVIQYFITLLIWISNPCLKRIYRYLKKYSSIMKYFMFHLIPFSASWNAIKVPFHERCNRVIQREHDLFYEIIICILNVAIFIDGHSRVSVL